MKALQGTGGNDLVDSRRTGRALQERRAYFNETSNREKEHTDEYYG